MRDYGKIAPGFWIGETGKRLRGHPDAQVLAIYLMTSPHSSMTGIFHCPTLYMGHETGLGTEGASKALARLIEEGFCEYEAASETVFVIRMAAYQIASELKDTDKRVDGLRKEYAKLPQGPIKQRFFAEYKDAFHLEVKSVLPPEPEAPSKPHASQEQEQEQEQAQEQEITTSPESVDSNRCPVNEIIEIYKTSCPSMPRPRIVPDAVKAQISARWRQSPKHQSLEFWKEYFEYCEQNNFLAGRAPGRNGGKPFRASLEWLVTAGNFAKVINENYEDATA